MGAGELVMADDEPRLREEARRRRGRSVAIAVVLGVLVAIFYAITIVKLGSPPPVQP